MIKLAGTDYFIRLGDLIEERWRAEAFSECAFAEIATSVLSELAPCDYLSFLDVVESCAFSRLPTQEDIEAAFGQPPVTIYTGQYFRIELLFWIEGVPSIHQHAFSGAFHVLHGSSLHSLWSFDERLRIRPSLLLGEMRLKYAELLSAGDTRRIDGGIRFIHSTFHLARPSVTIVVRTIREEHNLPQHSYWPPSIAYDQQSRSPELVRRLQILQMLARCERRRDFKEILYTLVDNADCFSLIYYFLEAYPLLSDETERNELCLAVRLKQPTLAEYLIRAALEQERRNHVIAFRRRIQNPDLQFFLALLLNLPEPDAVFDLIRHRYAEREPVAAISGWLIELQRMGLLDTQFDEHGIRVLSILLRGAEEPADATLPKTDNERNEVKDEATRDIAAELKRDWLFGPLLVGTTRRTMNATSAGN